MGRTLRGDAGHGDGETGFEILSELGAGDECGGSSVSWRTEGRSVIGVVGRWSSAGRIVV